MAQTKDAVAQLQDQIETIRREAYEEGGVDPVKPDTRRVEIAA